MSEFIINVQVNDVAESDVTDLAQEIWDENAENFDAILGQFGITISKDGFPFDWEPKELA